MADTATQLLNYYELWLVEGPKPFIRVSFDDVWVEKLLLYMALYDIDLYTPKVFLIPALEYWWQYDLPPRIYFTDRQLT